MISLATDSTQLGSSAKVEKAAAGHVSQIDEQGVACFLLVDSMRTHSQVQRKSGYYCVLRLKLVLLRSISPYLLTILYLKARLLIVEEFQAPC